MSAVYCQLINYNKTFDFIRLIVLLYLLQIELIINENFLQLA